MGWEYRVIGIGGNQAEATLNELGAEGFELVTVKHIGTTLLHYLKREVYQPKTLLQDGNAEAAEMIEQVTAEAVEQAPKGIGISSAAFFTPNQGGDRVIRLNEGLPI